MLTPFIRDNAIVLHLRELMAADIDSEGFLQLIYIHYQRNKNRFTFLDLLILDIYLILNTQGYYLFLTKR